MLGDWNISSCIKKWEQKGNTKAFDLGYTELPCYGEPHAHINLHLIHWA